MVGVAAAALMFPLPTVEFPIEARNFAPRCVVFLPLLGGHAQESRRFHSLIVLLKESTSRPSTLHAFANMN
jgi:hypothetical protein